ncbi:glycosyltransferase family 92 protein [Dyadobacter sandarakinus]|uniref:Glycosyltransferase family 2 protein n=1 Tax=Dyadobacter sandarakinus TaxID=2747268 RepID=A0ABX7I5Z2_9BACT|nr:glycosyltransferase family 92 protein [Dyadobacter sandarakinus]QRR01153.1 glycosyltransferase family 2 protein [Dyadobacter sandarakinus]
MNILTSLFSKFFAKNNTHISPEHYVSVCCIVKDENNYLEEWIRYHQKIGVSNFYIYDNGSKIPVRETIKELNLDRVVAVIDIPGKNKHVKAYQHCLDKFGSYSQWIAFIDVDEFIVPKTNEGSLVQFLKNYEDFGGLGVSWLIFGSAGHIQKPAGSQLRNFTKRSDLNFLPNTHIKSIVQPRFVASAFKSHCFKYKPGYDCVNEHQKVIDGATTEPSVDTIQLNHYYCRSLEEYHEKITRGISDTKRARKIEEFNYHDAGSNAIEDREILKILDQKEA